LLRGWAMLSGMPAPARQIEPLRVLIAGGGFAALEAGLALRALAGDRIGLAFISPDPVMHYRAAASVEAFSSEPAQAYGWPEIAEDLHARHYLGRLEAVAPQRKFVRLASGMRLDYDVLILCIGARALASVAGARTFRDQRDLPGFRGLLAELAGGRISRLVFAVPPGTSWPLPLYELALSSAAHAQRAGALAEISIVTPEAVPLAVFGSRVSKGIRAVLDEHEVRFVPKSTPMAVRRDGALELQADGALPADAVVTVPQLCAHRISGVPASWWGFVPTDARGRVEGLEDVYAAGDVCTFPVKQGGLATQQADRIAHTIASGLGLAVKEPDERTVLQARLVGGPTTLYLRSELDWQGHATVASIQHTDPVPIGSPKVFGRYLAPYLELRAPLAA
jgi:sulfide:quinone oxidoreductase